MTRTALLIALLAFAPLTVRGADGGVVEVPKPAPPKWVEFKCAAGAQLHLSAGEKAARWFALDAGCELSAVGSVAVFTAPASGRYRCVAVSGELVLPVLVVVGNPPPPPPDVPPKPVDALKAKLAAAYAADAQPDASKRDAALSLKALCTVSAEFVEAKGEDGEYTVATAGDMLTRYKDAAKTLVKGDALTGVRKVIASEFAALFPVDGPLSAEQRSAAAMLFKKLAEGLDSLGG